MADPALLAEAYKRGLLPADKAAAYEEAMRRGLVIPVKAKANALLDAGRQYLGGLSEGVSGLSDMVQQASPVGMVMGGLRNAANLATYLEGPKAADLVTGKPKSSPNITAAPFSQQTSNATRATPQAQTTAGRYARVVGQMTPNALAPGSAAARVANVVLPAVGSETAGHLAEQSGANPFGVAAARTAGALGGAGLASIRVANPFSSVGQTAEEQAANIFAKRTNADPAVLRQRAEDMQAAGVEPTLIDVGGDKGRRLVRALGVKSESGGEALANNAREVSSTAKPAIMSRTRGLGPNQGQSAEEVAGNLRTARDEAASTQYKTPYETPVSVTSETLKALSDEPGRQALLQARRAAVARMDDNQVAELDSLLGAAGKPPTTVSAGTLDRVRIALRERAKAAVKKDQGAYASGLKQRQSIVDETLDNTPALGAARADYRAKSQALGVLGKDRLDVHSTDPADYGKWLESLSPEARNANKVAVRQEILDTLGGQRSSTFGSVDELATSQYARANLKQALGPEADGYLANLQGRLDQVRNARMVDPNGGSRTAVLENDLSGVIKPALDVGKSALRGDVLGVAAKLGQWFLSRGVSPDQARILAKASVDPAQLPKILAAIEARAGKEGVQQFLQIRNAGIVGAASTVLPGTVQARSRQPEQR